MKFSLYIAVVLTASLCACASYDVPYAEEVAGYTCDEVKTEITFQKRLKEDIIGRSEHMHPMKSIMAISLSLGTDLLAPNSPVEGKRTSKRLNKIDKKLELLEEIKYETCTKKQA